MIRPLLRVLLPGFVLSNVRDYRNRRRLKKFRELSDKEIFDSIYRNCLWGGPAGQETRSGSGSLPEQSREYENLVVDYVDHEKIETILDFGCGDFQVSERIFNKCKQKPVITGIDISEVIIRHNIEKYKRTPFKFLRYDEHVELPHSDLITIRQVLQHNSNDNIAKILARVKDCCAHVIIAEHVPHNPKARNLDLQTSMLTRMTIESGVFVEEPPFNLPIHKVVNIDWSATNLGEGLLRVTFSSANKSPK